MDRILCRTYTEKSILYDSKKYKNQTIDTIIKVDKNYLIYCYYHFSKVNFVQSILEKLGITRDFIIPKPSKDSEMYHKFCLHRIKCMNEDELTEHFKNKKTVIKREIKLREARLLNAERKIFSKSNLQTLNQNKNAMDYNRAYLLGGLKGKKNGK